MRSLIALCALSLSLASCGFEEIDTGTKVLTGRFEVELTTTSDSCNVTTPGEVQWQTWIIAKDDSCDCYTLAFEDDDGNQMEIATSSDGHFFTGGVAGPLVPGSSCPASINWTVEPEYGSSEFTGTSTATLGFSCRSDTCSVVSDLIGRPD